MPRSPLHTVPTRYAVILRHGTEAAPCWLGSAPTIAEAMRLFRREWRARSSAQTPGTLAFVAIRQRESEVLCWRSLDRKATPREP
jgi:hypothetical protein